MTQAAPGGRRLVPGSDVGTSRVLLHLARPRHVPPTSALGRRKQKRPSTGSLCPAHSCLL